MCGDINSSCATDMNGGKNLHVLSYNSALIMKTVSIRQAKAKFLELVEQVQYGEDIVINPNIVRRNLAQLSLRIIPC
jgi:hypothetical protein